jgi:DNA repair protein RecO (recombination protein O)
MPVRRARAIVLRAYRVGEADKLVVFLTLELGKIRGMAKSARRARSRFGASLETGTEVEVTFFEKESRELVSVDRCDIVRSEFARFGEPTLATTLGYVTDLADAFVPEREPNARLYRLLRAVVFALAGGDTDTGSADAKARYFEAWLLRLSGVYPWRRSCPACGNALVERGAGFSVEERRLGCRGCIDRGMALSPDAVRFIESVWKHPPGVVEPPRAKGALAELSAFHYRLIQDHLEKELRSHHVLEEMLRGAGGS